MERKMSIIIAQDATNGLYQIEGTPARIGGKDPTKFAPNFNVPFFCESIDEKFFFNFNRTSILTAGRSEQFSNGEIRLTTGIETDIFKLTDDGNLKWNIELASKPASNVFEWEFTCNENVEFYYQPIDYSAWEQSVGAYRPDHIKGSYAVYCNKSGHYLDEQSKTIVNYHAGKLGHINRPLIIDSAGPTEWGELYIEKTSPTTGILRITVTRQFLNQATYPVTIDPEFGYHPGSPPGTSGGFANCYGNIGGSHTAVTGDTITSYSFYGRYTGSGTVKASAYTIVAAALNARLAAGTTISLGAVNNWYTSGAVSQALTNGVTYGLGSGDETGSVTFFYDAAAAGSLAYDSSTASLPATWTETGPYAYLLGLYATYTAGGGGATALTPSDIASATSVTTAAISAIRQLAINDPASATAVGNAILTVLRAISLNDLNSATSVGDVLLDVKRGLNPSDVACLTSVTDILMTVKHALAANDVIANTAVSAVAISALRELTLTDVASATSAGPVTVATPASIEITPSNISAASAVGTLILQAIRAINASDVACLTTVGSPTIAVTEILETLYFGVESQLNHITAASVAITAGSPAGTNDGTKRWNDGTAYAVTEVAADPGFDFEFTFAVRRILGIACNVYYNGAATHDVYLKIYNYTTASYEVVFTIIDGKNYSYLEMRFPKSDSDYISGGLAKLQFYHDDTGNPSHTLNVDYLAIIQ